MEVKIAELFTRYQKGLRQAIRKYQKKEEAWKYAEASLTLFTIAFFVIFAIRPAVTTIAGLVGEIKEKEKISLQMRKKINSIIAAQEEYALYQERVNLIDDFLPTELEFASGLAQVVGAAGEAKVSQKGVRLAEIEIGGPKKTAKSAKVVKDGSRDQQSLLEGTEFSFNGSAEFFDFKNFINYLLKTRRWIEITQYQLGKDIKEEGSQIKISVNGKMYFWSVTEK